MDIFKKIKIEILPWLNNENIPEHMTLILKELSDAITNKSIMHSIFFLTFLKDWYADNQLIIQTDEFELNKIMHKRFEEKIKEYLSELKRIQDSENESEYSEKKTLFISHSNRDKAYCDAFVSMLESIGVPENSIIYTSSSRHGVPGGGDIFEYLRRQINQGTTVYYLLSENYYESVYCQNEMGAAWVTKSDHIVFMLPSFKGPIKGVINSNTKAFSLSDPIDVIELKNSIVSFFKLPRPSEGKWEMIKNEFLEKMRAS